MTSTVLVNKIEMNPDFNLELKRLQKLSSVQTNYMTQVFHRVSARSRQIKKLNREHALENSKAQFMLSRENFDLRYVLLEGLQRQQDKPTKKLTHTP